MIAENRAIVEKLASIIEVYEKLLGTLFKND